MFRRILVGAGALLAALHLWLFGSQLWGGELADVSLVVRWLVAVGLLVGLRGLRRQRASIVWGRKAVALWLLVALLHGPALAERMGADSGASAPGLAATLVQIAAPTVVFGSLLLLAFMSGARRRDDRARESRVLEPVLAGLRSRPSRLPLAPRPPPQM